MKSKECYNCEKHCHVDKSDFTEKEYKDMMKEGDNYVWIDFCSKVGYIEGNNPAEREELNLKKDCKDHIEKLNECDKCRLYTDHKDVKMCCTAFNHFYYPVNYKRDPDGFAIKKERKNKKYFMDPITGVNKNKDCRHFEKNRRK